MSDLEHRINEKNLDDLDAQLCSTPQTREQYIAQERIKFEAWLKLQVRADNQGWTPFDIWLGAKADKT